MKKKIIINSILYNFSCAEIRSLASVCEFKLVIFLISKDKLIAEMKTQRLCKYPYMFKTMLHSSMYIFFLCSCSIVCFFLLFLHLFFFCCFCCVFVNCRYCLLFIFCKTRLLTTQKFQNKF